MVYNESALSDMANPISAFGKINQATDDLYMSFGLFAMWLIFFMILRRNNSKVAAAGAGFIVSLVALFMYYMEWVGFKAVIMPLVILGISLVATMFTD